METTLESKLSFRDKICQGNKKLSTKVWDFMKYVDKVGEESITDYLLWQWSKLNTKFHYLSLDKHDKYKEHYVSGADFELELWILTKKHTIPFVFQAKKMLIDYNSYRAKFNYGNGRQIQVLQTFANNPKHPRLPFYIFYAPADTSTRTKCRYLVPKKTAIFITDAKTVLDFINKHPQNKPLSKNNILNKTIPFHCLFCCPILQKDIKRFFKRYFPSMEGIESIENIEIPNYVDLIANNEIISISEETLKGLSMFKNIGVLDLRSE